MATVQELQKNGFFNAVPELMASVAAAEVIALTPIASPATATAEDVANAVNAIIAALQA